MVSDCGAVSDIVHKHKFVTDPEKADALSVTAGLDLESSVIQPRKRLKSLQEYHWKVARIWATI